MDTAKEDGKVEVAKEMILDNESIEKIVKYTKLSVSQIKEIANDLNKTL